MSSNRNNLKNLKGWVLKHLPGHPGQVVVVHESQLDPAEENKITPIEDLVVHVATGNDVASTPELQAPTGSLIQASKRNRNPIYRKKTQEAIENSVTYQDNSRMTLVKKSIQNAFAALKKPAASPINHDAAINSAPHVGYAPTSKLFGTVKSHKHFAAQLSNVVIAKDMNDQRVLELLDLFKATSEFLPHSLAEIVKEYCCYYKAQLGVTSTSPKPK